MKIIKYVILLSLATISYAEIDYNRYFLNCDKIIDNTYFKSCYNYNYRSTTASYIELDGKVNINNIADRFEFYEETNIPTEYRVKSSDYTNSGFDRGHIQSDASNDYSIESRNSTYTMSNITLQYPITNRRSYLKVEKRERELLTFHNKIKSLTLIKYTDKKYKNISIPETYYKIFYNSSFIECYKIPNDNKSYKLDEMKINCDSLL